MSLENFDDDDFLDDEEDREEDGLEDEEIDLDFSELQDLLEEGLEPKKPKRKMNPNSLNNLRRGGIDENIKKDKLSKREEEIKKRMDRLAEDPVAYYKETLMRNLIKEEINLEELQDDLATEYVKGNQQKLRQMIYSTIQSLLLIGDAMKAMPKQNKEEDRKSVAASAQVLDEFRKTLDPKIANNPDKLRAEIEKLRQEEKGKLDRGETH